RAVAARRAAARKGVSVLDALARCARHRQGRRCYPIPLICLSRTCAVGILLMLSAAAAALCARRRARRVILALLCVAASACDSSPAELPKPLRIHNGLVTSRNDLDRNRIDRETRYVLRGPSQRLDLTV